MKRSGKASRGSIGCWKRERNPSPCRFRGEPGVVAAGGTDRPEPCARGFLAPSPRDLAIGNPRSLNDPSLSQLVQFLDWYDRDVASAVFETDRALMEQTDDRELASRVSWFLSWLVLDPRATVARVEQLRATTDLDTKAILELRENVGLRLGQSYEDQWRSVWFMYGYGRMKAPLDRDIW